jgi:serine/threonine-protein kinase
MSTAPQHTARAEAEGRAQVRAQVRKIFDAVADMPPQARSDYILAHAESDTVAREVHALLSHLDDGATAAFAAPLKAAIGESAAPPPKPGDVLGVWRVTREIGHGGMGSVLEVARNDGLFTQTAAMKLLRGAARAEMLEYFTRERQTLATLTHPNIARLLDGGTTAMGRPWLVMEYVDGLSIDQYCREKSLGQRDILMLFRAVCGAIQFAHRHLIVHCDLKPSNVLVDAEGRPVLLDFGIARLAAGVEANQDAQTDALISPAPAAVRATGRFWMYTPRYASPEQRAGGAVTTASDVYSLGVMLQELLAGTSSATDDALRAIIARAMVEDAAARYASVEALSEDIARYVSHLPVEALAPTPSYVLRLFVRRHRLAVGLGAVAFASLVLGSVLAWNGYRAAERERDAAVAARALAEHERKASEAVADFMTNDLLLAADVNQSGDAASITVLEAVDRASQQFGKRLAGQPAVEGRVRMAIGNVLKHLNQMDKAAPQLDQAQQLLSGALGPESPLALEALNAAAGVHLRTGDFDRAKAEYDDGYQRTLRALGEADPLTLNFLGQRIVIAFVTQDLAVGIPLAEWALRLPALAEGKGNDERRTQIENNLGRMYAIQGRFAEAEALHQKAVAYRVKRFGPSAFNTLEAKGAVAAVYRQTGRLNDAEAIYEEMLTAYKRQTGERHAAVATAMNNMARVRLLQGRHEEAIALARRALVITEDLFGPGRFQSGTFKLSIASNLVALKRYGDAIPLLEEADAIYAKQLPLHHLERQEVFMHLARAYAAQGRNADAQAAAAKRTPLPTVVPAVRNRSGPHP